MHDHAGIVIEYLRSKTVADRHRGCRYVDDYERSAFFRYRDITGKDKAIEFVVVGTLTRKIRLITFRGVQSEDMEFGFFRHVALDIAESGSLGVFAVNKILCFCDSGHKSFSVKGDFHVFVPFVCIIIFIRLSVHSMEALLSNCRTAATHRAQFCPVTTALMVCGAT